MQDDLLAKMVGNWRILRLFPNRTAENAARIEWVLNGHWLRIEMEDLAVPASYAAHVYITRMDSDQSYSIHWLDTFGGTLPEVLGVGHQTDNSIVFTWKEADSELRNTYSWHADTGSWTSRIEQTNRDGNWTVFCTDTYTRQTT